MVVVSRLLFTLLGEGGKAGHRALELEGERIRVGSHRGNEALLNDRLVSRFRCVLTLANCTWMLTDTDSLNGTYLSGVRVREAYLPPGIATSSAAAPAPDARS